MATKKSTTKAKADNDDMPVIETPEPPPIPAGAKRPQDRKRKAEDPVAQIVTVRGVEFTLPPDALDDFELLDDIDELENGNPGRMPRILKRLAGDAYKDLLDTIRDEDTGRVRIEDGGKLVNEVLGSIDPNF